MLSSFSTLNTTRSLYKSPACSISLITRFIVDHLTGTRADCVPLGRQIYLRRCNAKYTTNSSQNPPPSNNHARNSEFSCCSNSCDLIPVPFHCVTAGQLVCQQVAIPRARSPCARKAQRINRFLRRRDFSASQEAVTDCPACWTQVFSDCQYSLAQHQERGQTGWRCRGGRQKPEWTI